MVSELSSSREQLSMSRTLLANTSMEARASQTQLDLIQSKVQSLRNGAAQTRALASSLQAQLDGLMGYAVNVSRAPYYKSSAFEGDVLITPQTIAQVPYMLIREITGNLVIANLSSSDSSYLLLASSSTTNSSTSTASGGGFRLVFPYLTNVGGEILVRNVSVDGIEFPILVSVVQGFKVFEAVSLLWVSAPALQEITLGPLFLSVNQALKFVAFDSLVKVGGFLFVDSSRALESLSFPRLERILSVGVKISQCFSIRTLDFPSLVNVVGFFHLQELVALVQMHVPSLVMIQHFLRLGGLNSLPGMDFPVLQSIGKELVINNNLVLSSINFPALKNLSSDLYINFNDLLEKIAFDSLESIGSPVSDALGLKIGSVVVSYNPKLTSIDSLCTKLTKIDGPITSICKNPSLLSLPSCIQSLAHGKKCTHCAGPSCSCCDSPVVVLTNVGSNCAIDGCLTP